MAQPSPKEPAAIRIYSIKRLLIDTCQLSVLDTIIDKAIMNETNNKENGDTKLRVME
jgi:hypothetical protein